MADEYFSDSELQCPATSANATRDLMLARLKRKWEEGSTAEMDSFKNEIKEMFASFLSVQKQESKKTTEVIMGIQETNTIIKNALTTLVEQNENFSKKIVELEEQVREDKKHIAILEDKIEQIQLESRKANFEIKDVPKKPNETKDDLIDVALCLTKTIGCQFDKKDIVDIYRVRPKKEGTVNTPIVVETSSTLIKTDVLKMAKAYNVTHKPKLSAKHVGLNNEAPIYVSEHLTAKASRLHFLARDLVRSKRFKFCWTAYGKIYIRKDERTPIIQVKTEAQIQKLMNEVVPNIIM